MAIPIRRRLASLAAAASLGSALLIVQWPAPSPAATFHKGPSLSTAKKALLRLSDFPVGWTAQASSNSNSNFPGASELAKCLGVPESIVTYNAPSVNSPEFSTDDQLLTASDSVSVYSSAAAALASHDSLANSKAPACLTTTLNGAGKKSLESEFGSTARIGKIVITRYPSTDFASNGANFGMQMTLTEKGVTAAVGLIFIDYVHGVQEQTVAFTYVDEAFPGALARQLTVDAAGRI